MFTINGIHILANVIIVDPTHANLILWIVFSQGMIATIVTWAKVVSCHNWHLKDDFIPLVVDTFGYLHQQANNFLHQCANMTWLTKCYREPSFSILHSFYRQKVFVALKTMQAVTIQQHAIVVTWKACSRLGVF
jgi:hypothetical protein